MQDIDLSGRQKLLLSELLEYLNNETGKPIVDWLHKIVLAIDPNGNSKHKLAIRPDKTWGIQKFRIEPIYSTPWTDAYVSNPRGARYTGDRHVPYLTLWNFEESILASYTTEPQSIQEPRGLSHALNTEGIKIHSDDFRAWCEAIEHPLPKFWFSETKQQQSPPKAQLPKPPLQPEEIVKQCQNKHFKNNQIAAEILRQYPNISNYELGELLPANPGTTIAHDSISTQGKRLKRATRNIEG